MSREHRLSTGYKGAADDIKRGLQKIKEAQIQVMKELRRDDTQTSRNHSLTYSRQTNHDTKNNNNFRFGTQTSANKQKIDKFQKQALQFALKQSKYKQQIITLGEQARKWKQLATKADYKMKQYDKNSQRALAKAQQALANAISSEKKYVDLKNQYDKVYKEKQRQSTQMKRLQSKQISDLIAHNEKQKQLQLTTKIIKQFRYAHQSFTQLVAHINSHKCTKKQNTKTNTTNTYFSTNGFSISTFEAQSRLDKHINNVILYLNNLQTFTPIQQISSRIYGNNTENQNYLSHSFKQDIKKIQQQMDDGKNNTKDDLILELQSQNKQLVSKNNRYQLQIIKCKQQMKSLLSRYKQIKTQNEILKLNSHKNINTNQQLQSQNKIIKKQNRSLFQKYKNLAKINENNNMFDKLQQYKSNKDMHYIQKQQNHEIFQDRIIELQKQNQQLNIMIKNKQQKQNSLLRQIYTLQEQNNMLKNQIQRLQKQVQSNNLTNSSKNSKQQQQQQKTRQLIEVITKLQEERQILMHKQNQLTQRLQKQSQKYIQQVQQLSIELQNLKKQLDILRKQSSDASHGQSFIVDKIVQQLWEKKQEHFTGAHTILEQINSKSFKRQVKKTQMQSSQKQNSSKNGYSPINSRTVIQQNTPKQSHEYIQAQQQTLITSNSQTNISQANIILYDNINNINNMQISSPPSSPQVIQMVKHNNQYYPIQNQYYIPQQQLQPQLQSQYQPQSPQLQLQPQYVHHYQTAQQFHNNSYQPYKVSYPQQGYFIR